MKKFSHIVMAYRRLIIIAVLLITGVMGFFLKDIKVNPDITTYFPADDSVVSRFNYIGNNYSSNSLAIIILQSHDVFSVQTLEHVRDLTNIFNETEGVDYVTSLTSVMDIRTAPDSSLEISRLIDEFNLPRTDEELRLTKEYVLSEKLYVGRLISADARYTTIVCNINPEVDKNEVSKKIREIVQEMNLPEKVYFEGIPFQLLNIFEYIIRDFVVLVPLIIVLIAITLLLSFRSLRGVLIPVATVVIGVVWTMGLMALCGVALTPLSDAIPVVLFAIGSAYGIHIVNKFNAAVTDPAKRKEQSVLALSEVGLPVLLTGVTTVMGLFSFIVGAYLVIVKDFGIFSALGVLFILFNSLTFTPAVLSYLKPLRRKQTVAGKRMGGNLLERLLDKIAGLATRKSKAVLITALIIGAVSLAGIPLVKNKIDILNYFRESTSIRQSAAVMNREFGGSIPVLVIARGDLQEPAVMEGVKKMQVFLGTLPKVQNAQSIADFIEKMSDAIGEGRTVPESREKIANLWFLIEGEENLRQIVNPEKSEAVIAAYMVNAETSEYHDVNNAIDEYISRAQQPGLTFAKTGMASVYANLDVSLMKNLIQSLLIALGLVFISMSFLVRSLKGAITGILPLVFAMIFIFGFMGMAGIALDIATVLIASITVGVGIDYSIHFVTAYRNFIRQGSGVDEAIRKTMHTSGKAIVINVLTICFGFLVLIFANLLPLVNFGILIAVSMFISGFGAITLLPAFISTFKLRMGKKKPGTGSNPKDDISQ